MMRPRTPTTEILLTLAGAAWGLGAGITIATLWVAEPHAGQLPGAMLAHGLDARGPLRAILSVIIAPLIAAFLIRPLAARASTARPWVVRAMAVALASGLWLALVDPFESIAILFVPPMAAGVLFLARGIEGHFTRRDIILIPCTITLYMTLAAIVPAMPLPLAILVAAAIVLALRVLVATMPGTLEPAYAFALVPLALLFHIRLWFGDSSALAIAALLLAVASPPLLRGSLRATPQRFVAYVTYPLFAIALIASSDLASAEGMPRLNLFEDGHSMTPASAMLHGARPYRDVVPGHGLIADGLLDLAAMKLGAANAGAALRTRGVIAALLPAAVYAVALAATGSAEVAILALLATACIAITGTPWVLPVSAIEAMPPLRPIPSLFALAFCAVALRLRSRRAAAMAGFFAIVAVLTSIEFGFYAIVAVAITVLRFRDRRVFVSAAAGGAIAAIPAALLMLIAGCLGAFLRVTLFEILPLRDVYTIGFFDFPAGQAAMRALPEIAAGLFTMRTVWIALWGAIAIATSAGLVFRQRRAIEPLLVLGAWVIVSALSYAERTNVYFMPVAVIMVVAAAHRLRRSRSALAVATIVIMAMSAPTARLLRDGALRRQHGADSAFVRYSGAARASGVWMNVDNAQKVAAAQTFVDHALAPSETFFDFANMPILYYLFDRRLPVRQYETPFYESDDLQREVISRLESDRSVRAALMQFPNRGDLSIDGVPNTVRAPLVFAWLRAHFVPAYARDGVVFWVRIDQPRNL
jgi:hypothetical protein